MAALIGFLRGWAPLIGLVALGMVLRLAIPGAYRVVKHRLDREHPDDLPIHAGQWLEEEVAGRGIDVKVLVAPTKNEDVDAFLPSAQSIILSQETYYKKDPSFWAVAAHELGHALVYRSARWIAFVLKTARVVAFGLASVANLMILANIMFASPEINRLAFTLASVGLGMFVLVLLDELCASILGLGILRRDARVDARGRRGAWIALAAGFMTYGGGFAGQSLLVWEREFVVARIEEHRRFVPADRLGSGWLLLTAALSVPVIYLAWREIRQTLGPTHADTADEAKRIETSRALREVGRGALTLGFVAIVWSQPFGIGFAIACVLAVLASKTAIAVLLSPVMRVLKYPLGLVVILIIIPVVLALFAVRRLRTWLFGARPPEPPSEAKTEPSEGPFLSAEALRSAALLEAYRLELANRPPWTDRLPRIAFAVCQAALVVAFWKGVVSG